MHRKLKDNSALNKVRVGVPEAKGTQYHHRSLGKTSGQASGLLDELGPLKWELRTFSGQEFFKAALRLDSSMNCGGSTANNQATVPTQRQADYRIAAWK